MDGIRVKIRFTNDSPFRGGSADLRNVTEIHYGYRADDLAERIGQAVAFESDILSTGNTYNICDVAEFSTSIETAEQE